MSADLDPEQWRQASQHFSDCPRFVAHWLAQYCRRERLSVSRLAEQWGTSKERLWLLSLCGVPRRNQWTDDLNTLAELAGIDAGRLALLFRDAENLK